MLPPPSYILGGLVMHFDPQGRRLGDMVAGTCVIVEKFDLAAQGASGAAWASRVETGTLAPKRSPCRAARSRRNRSA